MKRKTRRQLRQALGRLRQRGAAAAGCRRPRALLKAQVKVMARARKLAVTMPVDLWYEWGDGTCLERWDRSSACGLVGPWEYSQTW